MVSWGRWAVGFVLLVAGFSFFMAAVSTAASTEAKQMRELTEEEHSLINRSAAFVLGFREARGRLPIAEEFRTWMLSDPRERFGFEMFGFRYIPAEYWSSPSLEQRIGPAPVGAYVFEWRLYGHSTFPSWSPQRHSAYLVDEHYFSFGAKWRDVTIFSSVGLLLLVGCLVAIRPKGADGGDAR